jgi:hypothetical protein
MEWVMSTFRSIIDKWPSLAEFASDLGVKYVTAQLMRHRNSIAPKHWKNVVSAARDRKITGVTLEVLAAMKADSPPEPPKARVTRSTAMSRVA